MTVGSAFGFRAPLVRAGGVPVRTISSALSSRSTRSFSLRSRYGCSRWQNSARASAVLRPPALRRSWARSDMCICSSSTFTWQPLFDFEDQPLEIIVQFARGPRNDELRLAVAHLGGLPNVSLAGVHRRSPLVLAMHLQLS